MSILTRISTPPLKLSEREIVRTKVEQAAAMPHIKEIHLHVSMNVDMQEKQSREYRMVVLLTPAQKGILDRVVTREQARNAHIALNQSDVVRGLILAADDQDHNGR